MIADPDANETIDAARVSNLRAKACRHLARARPAPMLTVVIPTFNESSNVPTVIERVAAALASADWEIIFVDDDFPDSTSTVARRLGELDGRVRCIRRVGAADWLAPAWKACCRVRRATWP